MNTTTLCPSEDDHDEIRQLKDDKTRELPPPPQHVRCPVCMALNHPAAGHCVFCGKVFDGKCPSCGL